MKNITRKAMTASALIVMMCVTGFTFAGCNRNEEAAKDKAYASTITEDSAASDTASATDTADIDHNTGDAQIVGEENDDPAETVVYVIDNTEDANNDSAVKTVYTSDKQTKNTQTKKSTSKSNKSNTTDAAENVKVDAPVETSEQSEMNVAQASTKTSDCIDMKANWKSEYYYFDEDEQYDRYAQGEGSASIKYVSSKVFELEGKTLLGIHYEETTENTFLNQDGSAVPVDCYNNIKVHENDYIFTSNHPTQEVVNKDTGETEVLDLRDPNLCALEDESFAQIKEWMTAEGISPDKDLFSSPGLGYSVSDTMFDSDGHADVFEFWIVQRADVPVKISVVVSKHGVVRASEITPAEGTTQEMTIELK